MANAPLREGGLLGDRYALEGLIGRGGMAEVYRAHDRVLGRQVAVKLIRNVACTEGERARFTREAQTLARLSHPGLVTILDAATADAEPYLVMELIDGPSLAACCRRGALEPARVAAIGAQLADALGHAHSAGVVHRDLKPGNVLLDAVDDRAKLADFGIARLLSETTRHTTTGVTVGTAAYLAPEQVRGQDITPAADVYSLGLVLLEALTSERAYRGLPVEAALARLVTPPAIPDTVPSPWHGLLRAMTALDPAERPSTDEAAATLRGLASQLDPATARLASSRAGMAGRQADHLVDRRRWVFSALCAALLVAPIGAAVTADHERRGFDLPANATPRSGTAATTPDNGELDAEHAEQILVATRRVPSRAPQSERRPSRLAERPEGNPDREAAGDPPVAPQGQQAGEKPHNDVAELRKQQTTPRKQSDKKTRKGKKETKAKAAIAPLRRPSA